MYDPTANPRRAARTSQKLASRRATAERYRRASRAAEREADRLLGVPTAWQRWRNEREDTYVTG